ncbi:amino acid permease/ SLC12A domain-containing protein [Xylariaceae sp. FL0804]|nr:amino acid permease/ SLC12A domain-containing protein [Xylariaceae sp. FL0804]
MESKKPAVGAVTPDVHSVFDGEQQQIEPHHHHHHHHGTTKHNISSRQAQMIAIGGVVGTGLFVGTGQVLAVSGPAVLFAAYAFCCLLAFCVVTATTEFNTFLPVRGASVPYYATRFASRSLGFALGWLYWYTWGIAVAYEVTAAALVIDYWPNAVPTAAWITVMLAVIVVLNFMPVRVYAESEFWFASLKVFTIIGLLVLSVVLFFGGGPSHNRLGFTYWYYHQAPAHEYLTGGSAGQLCAFIYALCNGAFAFLFGPEYVVSASGEMKTPRKDLPTTTRHFAWRLILFYGLGALAISVICPSDEAGLTDGGSGAAASPWVLGIKNAGIKGLDSVINAAIITSAWSAGNSLLYMSSRSLYSMALVGNAPGIFLRCNRWGVPYCAVGLTSLFGLLAYLNVSNSGGTVFNWLISVLNEGGFISWIVCCVVYLRFRKARLAQGVRGRDLPYTSVLQPYGAWFALGVVVLMALLNGFSSFFPGHFSASTFLTAYLGIPVFLILYAGHKLYARHEPWLLPPGSVDLVSGLDEVIAQEEHVQGEYESYANEKSKARIGLNKISSIWGWK